MQEVASGLKDLLEYDGDVEEDLCQTFMVKLITYLRTTLREEIYLRNFCGCEVQNGLNLGNKFLRMSDFFIYLRKRFLRIWVKSAKNFLPHIFLSQIISSLKVDYCKNIDRSV